MDLKSFPRAQDIRLDTGHRPPHHQQVFLEEVNEHGEPLKSTTHRKTGDRWVSFDLKDGFYALAIHPEVKGAFTINLNEQLLQLCAMPMG
jgi:hypothetical protein